MPTDELKQRIEELECEACQRGCRLNPDGLHYDDERGGRTWGVCRRVVAELERQLHGHIQSDERRRRLTRPKTSRKDDDDDECYALSSLLQQANLLSGLPNNSLSLFVEAMPT